MIFVGIAIYQLELAQIMLKCNMIIPFEFLFQLHLIYERLSPLS